LIGYALPPNRRAHPSPRRRRNSSRLPGAVAELLKQGEGLLAAGKGLLVVAEAGVEPADRIDGVGLPAPVAGGPKQVEGPPGVVERLGAATLLPPHDGEGEVGVPLSGQVTGLAVQVEGLPQLGVRVVKAAQPAVGLGEVAVGEALRGRVGQPLGGGHRGVLDSGDVMPMPVQEEEGRHGPGQLPGVGVEPGGGGVIHDSQQHGMLGGKPVESLLMAGEVFRGYSRVRCGKGDRIPGRVEQPGGGVGGVQVVVEYPGGGGAALFVGVHPVREVGRVGAQQVVEGEPAQ
jgi:hypothetical protein